MTTLLQVAFADGFRHHVIMSAMLEVQSLTSFELFNQVAQCIMYFMTTSREQKFED
jgi:hypothetical protein